MPHVTIISSTFRPGGIDIFLAGMRDQSYKDFEVILVDHRYERRRDRVRQLAKDYGVPLIHVPEHRRNGKWNVFISAWNTGIALARGDVLILLQDWTYAPRGWIEAHLSALDGKRRYVLAPYIYGQVPPLVTKIPFDFSKQMDRGGYCVDIDPILNGEVLDEIFAFQNGPFEYHWFLGMAAALATDQDVRVSPRGPLSTGCWSWIHVKNESITRKLMWELNGLDERLERGKGPMDLDLGIRLVGAGVELWWEPSAITYGPNARYVCRSMPWGSMHERLGGRWSYDDGLTYNERRRREIDAGGSPRALNSYDMQDLASLLDWWRTPDADPRSRDVSDEEYWNCKEIWPDTP